MAIRAMIVKPGQRPSVSYIDNDLKTLQALVDGPIEVLTYDHCVMIVNEEGKLRRDVGPCRDLIDGDGYYHDTLFGTIVIVGADGDEFVGLTHRQVDQWREAIDLLCIRLWW